MVIIWKIFKKLIFEETIIFIIEKKGKKNSNLDILRLYRLSVFVVLNMFFFIILKGNKFHFSIITTYKESLILIILTVTISSISCREI